MSKLKKWVIGELLLSPLSPLSPVADPLLLSHSPHHLLGSVMHHLLL